ncbi:protein kinase [Candidatus Dojkabacteria bacterium]|uniref:Protein kinase n=1 Tax=Candidatus Dojkabacteria bacterium TaxID=2099670 RepID=A0A955LBI1_9BACT|nr:protein kinase [Candidatus Dojkabacteria bacterium]
MILDTIEGEFLVSEYSDTSSIVRIRDHELNSLLNNTDLVIKLSTDTINLNNEFMFHCELNDNKMFANDIHALGWSSGELARVAKPVGIITEENEIIPFTKSTNYIENVIGLIFPYYGKPINQFLDEQLTKPSQRVKLISKVAKTIALLNSKGIIYDDICEDNILVNPQGKVTIIDFNTIQTIRHGHDYPTRLDTNMFYLAFTNGYEAPEGFKTAIDFYNKMNHKNSDLYLAYITFSKERGHQILFSRDDLNKAQNTIDPLTFDSYSIALLAEHLGVKIPKRFKAINSHRRGNIFELIQYLDVFRKGDRRWF